MVFGKHINKYYRKYLLNFLLGLIVLLAVDYAQLLIPGLYQLVLNGVQSGSVVYNGVPSEFNMEFLLDNICRPLLYVILIMVTGRFAWRFFIFRASIGMQGDLREEMFNNSRRLSQQYYQVNKVGDIMALFTNDLETLEECFGFGFITSVDAIFLGGLAYYKMFKMSPLLTVLSLIPLAILVMVCVKLSNTLTRKWGIRQDAYSALSDFSQESFSGIAVVKSFAKELKELKAFEKLNKDNENSNISFTKSATAMRVLVWFFIESVICIILGYGGFLVYKGVFNSGQLMEFIGYFTAAIWPAMAISEIIDMRSRGTTSLERISELLDAVPDVADRDDVTPLSEVKGSVEFRNLSFTYPGSDVVVLDNVSFKIEAGESVGLVGKTGAGKTCIVDLILRTYNVPDGTLFLDGRDVNTLPIKQVRDACAYVPQDNFLFSESIEKNIKFSDVTASSNDVESSAKLAAVHDNIMDFPEGYSTVLGERGVTVSGGQKQRISIARAFLKDSPILILDDSVSAVDTATERTILNGLRQTASGKTLILIAHRISTIRQMDKIVFLENGRVSAVGTHDELYAGCKGYRKMVELQKLEEEGAKHNA